MSSCITAPIAIIGVACRLPGGVNSLDSLWPILAEGRDAVSQIPADRWDTARFWHPRRTMPGHTVSVSAGVLDDIYAFDPTFFGISRKEAEVMDPQQRLLLELTWEALEDALIPPSSLAGSDTAVFVGAASPDAGTRFADDICATSPYSMTGTNLSIAANRISYIYNFHGPSLTIDTACSSSMYALHQACQILANGGAGMAVAGGVNVLLAPFPFVGFSQAHMLSPDGRCKVFDASGNGYVRAEGGGVLLLQPLEAALAQGRHIHAVIRGIACNSDGRTQGIALPSAEAQEDLLREIYECAGRKPDDLSYLEAHGTGTAAGDPVETAAIGRALGQRRGSPLVIGSIKCHLGHLETASAMAGIMKTLLVLREKRIPPQIHIKKLNPAIDLKELNLRVPLRMTRLPQNTGTALAGVNSFGFGGANGHLLLESAPASPQRTRKIHTIPPLFLTARSEASLRVLAGRYAERIENDPADHYHLAANAALKRETLPHRLVVEGDSPAVQVANLKAFAAATENPSCSYSEAVRPEKPLAAFVFSGNGGQWAGMGKALLGNAAFAAQVRKVAELMQPLCGEDMLAKLQHVTPEEMERTETAQQLLFMVQVGLCAALEEKGIRADMAYGHSVGEVAAAWYCGALSLKEAVTVIHYRSLHQGKTHGLGRMAAASISPEEARQLLADHEGVELAGINAADAVTLSGDETSLLRLGEALQQRKIFFRMLPLAYAFHSSRMDGVREGLLHDLKGIRGRKAQRIFISTVSGAQHEAPCRADYWWRNVREAVDFHKGTQTALDLGARFFLEIGPHNILLRYLRSGLRAAESRLGPLEGWVGGTLNRDGDCLQNFQQSWRTAWTHGWPLDTGKHFPHPAQYVRLPGYAWQKEDCQPAPTPECAGLIRSAAEHPLLGWRTPGVQQWENTLDLQSSPWIADHKVGESVYYPAAAFLEMALAAAQRSLGSDGPVEMLHTAILRPVIMQGEQAVRLRTVVEAADNEVRILARPHMRDEAWTLHARGRAVTSDTPRPVPNTAVLQPETFGEAMSPEELYRLTEKANMGYGAIFRPVIQCWRNGDSILARFAPAESQPQPWEKDMLMAPPLLDGGLQLLFPLIADWLDMCPAPRLPYWFERCTLFQSGRPVFALARRERASRRNVVCSLDLLDAEGQILLRLSRGYARTVERLAASVPDVFATRSLPVPHPSGGVPQGLPELETLAARFDTFCTHLCEQEARKHQSEIQPLREMAVLALARHMGEEPNCPRGLAEFLRRCRYGHEADFINDLPPFADIWRTLMAEAPADNAVNLLLANAAGTLLEGAAPTPVDSPLLEEYQRQEYSLGRDLLCKALQELLAAVPQGEALDVMEVGAGAGIFSRCAAPLLARHSHTITDRDAGTLAKLRLTCKGGVQTQFIQWDPEQDEAAPTRAHILLAAHSLHKADNVPLALRRCREALRPGGWLLLAERAPNRLDNLLLGQHEAWWQEGIPVFLPRQMTARNWQEAVLEAGFTEVQICCPASAEAVDFILLARVGGEQDAASVATSPAKLWLLCADADPAPELVSLSAALTQAGHTVLHLRPGNTLSLRGSVWQLQPDKAGHWQKLFEKLSADGQEAICVHGLGLQQHQDGLDWQDAQMQCASLSQLARGWHQAGRPALALRVLTRQALALPEGIEGLLHPVRSSVIGMARVLMNEMPALDCRCIDLHEAQNEVLCREVLQPTDEREVILHGSHRFVLRSEAVEQTASTGHGDALRLECRNPGRLESLSWLPLSKPQPGPGMVLVRVKAVGLNFRDVMWAMNLLPEEALENGFSGPGLGIECAGVVESVGENVSGVQPGQRVLCFGPHCFSSHVLTMAEAIAPMPDDWSFAAAAGVPVTFFTAWYALRHLADLQPGESLLIHGAAGGVGLAALQIASQMGLHVYATAGTEDKRRLLRLLGVEHIYDSRSLAFHDQILADTDGQGVDAVLNSLAGEGMDQSLRLLKPFGRFLELGKRDFYADSPLRLRPFRNNISYFGIDVDQLMQARPALGQKLFGEMMEHFRAGDWRPLSFTLYPAADVETAFRAMQQSRHVGKIVVEAPEVTGNQLTALPQEAMPVRADGTYIISGGLGGFGLATARRLAQRGAGALVLLSRRGATPDTVSALRELRYLGLPEGKERLELALAQDVTDAEGLAAALDTALEGIPPLRGIIHAAAVLEDVTLTGLTPQALERVLRPKLAGALALHQYSLDKKLDFFIMYSSATTLLGNPGQANYVAANMALESLAALRRSLGLPGLAVGWGAIGDAGMLTRDAAALGSLQRVSGITPLSAATALTSLEKLSADSGPAPAVLTADWKRLSRLPLGQSPRMAPLLPEGEAQESDSTSLRESIQGKSDAEALTCITEAVTAAVARILRVSASSLRPTTPLAELGMDSLMAVELGLALEEMLDGQSLSGGLSAGVSIHDLANRLYAILRGEESGQDDQLRRTLEASHGIAVRDDLAQAVLDAEASQAGQKA